MTGRRKGTGQARRPVESARRSIAMHKARVASAVTAAGRVRAAMDLLLALIRRVDPATANRAASRVVAEIGRVTRDLEKEIR